MTLRPVMTDEVWRAMAPGFGRCVLGDEVDICRFCGFGSLACDAATSEAGGLTCVCSLVLTTSRGHVKTPARPPAAPPVSNSSGDPISRLFLYTLAHAWNCSQNMNCSAEKGRSRYSVAL